MAQYDDPYNSSSAPSGRLPGSGETNPFTPGDATSSRYAPAEGGSQPSPYSPSGAANAAEEDWLNRPSLAARRRNQWRQYKHMTPDFGSPTPEARDFNPQSPEYLGPESRPGPASPPPREASLPSFKSRPGATGGMPPVVGRAAVGNAAASNAASQSRLTGQPRPLQVHPHSSAPLAPPSPSPSQRPGKVTPLRPWPGRPAPKADRAAHSLTGPEPVTALYPAADPGLAPPARPTAPRRRLAKPPLPVLYLIRLVILGVGVAAIAGTLLSILSPSNVASPNREGSPTATSPTATSGARSLGGRQGADSIAALQPTSELTRLKAQLEQMATLTPGLTPSLYALDLDSGRYVDLEGGKTVAAASTIKMPILVAFLQQVDAGTIALNQTLALQEHQVAGGSGSIGNDAVGSEYTALEVATRMITDSDNTATNMMIDALGGIDALNQQFAAWGLESTVLRNPLPDLDGTNTTSPKDLALLLGLIDQNGILSARSRDRMLSIMQRTVNRSLIAYSLTDGSIIANKTGDIAMALGDVALVDTPNGQRYVLALMVQRPNNDGRASELIRRLTDATHTELNQPLAPVGRPSTASPEPDNGSDNSTDMENEPTPEGDPTYQPDATSDPTYQPDNPSAPSPDGGEVPPG